MATATSSQSRWVYCAFCLGLGALFAWHAWSQASAHWTLASRGQRTEAAIVGYDEVRGRRSTTWYPVFQFATADGRRVRAASGASAEPAQSPAGSRVTVVYDPAHPATVQQASALEAGPGVTPWILGAMALLMFALASVFLLPRKPKATG
ncbi:DUF3592 domain-containing protein [Roseomonas sp. CAU 1739]|uniref:DUF3592 domain-containing protein n=1 Tax=Roseomonas sp. CAU 1739 TaxID=3140364 RepID=UPI00325A8369